MANLPKTSNLEECFKHASECFGKSCVAASEAILVLPRLVDTAGASASTVVSIAGSGLQTMYYSVRATIDGVEVVIQIAKDVANSEKVQFSVSVAANATADAANATADGARKLLKYVGYLWSFTTENIQHFPEIEMSIIDDFVLCEPAPEDLLG